MVSRLFSTLLLALAAPAAAPSAAIVAKAPIVREPLMQLRWSPATVGFAPAEQSLARRCPGLSNENYDHQLWVLARSGEVLVLSGRYIPRRAGLDRSEGDAGVVLRLSPKGCTLIGPARELFMAPSDYAPEVARAEAAALANDAANRFVAAYRGPAGLCAAMRAQGKRLASLPVTLRAPFRAKAPCLR